MSDAQLSPTALQVLAAARDGRVYRERGTGLYTMITEQGYPVRVSRGTIDALVRRNLVRVDDTGRLTARD